MIRRIACASLFLFPIFVLFLSSDCSGRKVTIPAYEGFLAARQDMVSKTLMEIYGRYSAKASGKTVRSEFNLLLKPGESAYLEIVDPAKKLLYSVSLNRNEVWLLWAQEGSFIQEPATAENLNAILGMPVLPDDLMNLVGGFGLKFGEWEMKGARKDGWNLVRNPFLAEIHLSENLSRIVVDSENAPELVARYDRYKLMENRSLPTRMRFEIPARKISIELDIEKTLPRDEPATPGLFAIKLPENAKRLQLKEVYHGNPLLLQ